ncbi:HAD family hydrolase [Mucilaginibacter sabulilitoris]|uniref:HAD family hydrolase n=1 Tax=Mucilaginibacter sabulilitoris TaxID=1173583 RepID=A0ABZ0TRP7_9SPHI|nr:HAD family hydrolase [Mucilaginibacter sabulilitoris]WPU95789.1 HAD family hydrolase [Mucilaginibacter sabulilitoris]
MQKKKYEVLLLDAANTIIYKPDLIPSFLSVLKKNGFDADEIQLRKNHKLLSEVIHFPDVTSKEFYCMFNNEVMLSMGIVSSKQLLDDIFANCSYLPWRPFQDTHVLKTLSIKKAILSNFNASINIKINNIFGDHLFDSIIGSEKEGIGKPNIEFYKRALDVLNVDPEKILYVGDSIKLDVVPARSIGIETYLIDRDRNFLQFNKRIDSLADLIEIIK